LVRYQSDEQDDANDKHLRKKARKKLTISFLFHLSNPQLIKVYLLNQPGYLPGDMVNLPVRQHALLPEKSRPHRLGNHFQDRLDIDLQTPKVHGPVQDQDARTPFQYQDQLSGSMGLSVPARHLFEIAFSSPPYKPPIANDNHSHYYVNKKSLSTWYSVYFQAKLIMSGSQTTALPYPAPYR
jgi:hypothetical protein